MAPVLCGIPPGTSSPTTTSSRAASRSASALHPEYAVSQGRRTCSALRSCCHPCQRRPEAAAADIPRPVFRPSGGAGGLRDRQSVRARPVVDHGHDQRAQPPLADKRADAKWPTSSRPTPRSIPATPEGRFSTRRGVSSASTAQSIHPRAPMPESVSRSPSMW